MKMYKTIFKPAVALAAIMVFGMSTVLHAKDETAFALIKEGNRYVGEQSKDKVVQIRSEKSIGGMTPSIWFIVYYDPDATFNATEVKFGAGKKMDVKRPTRLFEKMAGETKKIDSKKLVTDSDEALKTASAEPLLEKLKLTASQMWLDKGEEGPVWKVRLWAQKLDNPGKSVDVGDVYISAEDGKVLRSDLHINRVD